MERAAPRCPQHELSLSFALTPWITEPMPDEIKDASADFFKPPAKPPVPVSREAAIKRVAELEAKVAELEAAATKPPTSEAPALAAEGDLPHWLVSIPDGPAFVVAATDEANAEKAYKKAASIIATPHTPTCSRTELPVGRHKDSA